MNLLCNSRDAFQVCSLVSLAAYHRKKKKENSTFDHLSKKWKKMHFRNAIFLFKWSECFILKTISKRWLLWMVLIRHFTCIKSIQMNYDASLVGWRCTKNGWKCISISEHQSNSSHCLMLLKRNWFHSRFHQFPLTLNDFEMRSKSKPHFDIITFYFFSNHKLLF